MKHSPNRRSFLKKSVAAALTVPVVTSLEEYALASQTASVSTPPSASGSKGTLPTGTIGKVKISRLICGGNLISGYAHSRDLIYVSPLLNHYFTDEKIMETWALCEQHGINTMIAFGGDPHAVEVYRKYRAQGGRIQYLAQIAPTTTAPKTGVKEAVDSGAVGAFLVGNLGDIWAREGRWDGWAKWFRSQGLRLIAVWPGMNCARRSGGRGRHRPDLRQDLHDNNYWSKRRPDQMQEVIDNYCSDNYWCMDPKETIKYIAAVDRPWSAFKMLAACTIHPRSVFKYAFENGSYFAAVCFFDFQIAEDVAVANDVLKAAENRERAWQA